MREIDLKSYAKVNLSLDVTGTRPDGYHDLSSVMQRISLYDRIHMEWIRQEEAAAGEEPEQPEEEPEEPDNSNDLEG